MWLDMLEMNDRLLVSSFTDYQETWDEDGYGDEIEADPLPAVQPEGIGSLELRASVYEMWPEVHLR